ncbi:MAG TPA: antitoxin Xre-like helix-turn-helix domain-containing protein [Chitinophagaceae bacterium]|nr:antitoxin Xre-like helix-turn-helix domain-containing protein [Chitinophagaceae bacterium]
MESIMIMPVNRTDQDVSVRERFRNLKIGNRNQVFVAATKGVKAGVFYDLAEIAGMSDKELASTINLSARTVSNYKDARRAFEPVYGEHLLKLVALYIKGEEIFGNVSEFNYWLNKPLWKSTSKPLDWLITPGGVDLAMEEIEKIAQGYPI